MVVVVVVVLVYGCFICLHDLGVSIMTRNEGIAVVNHYTITIHSPSLSTMLTSSLKYLVK